MSVSHGQRLRRQMMKIVEDPKSTASEKLDAAKILADLLKTKIGERRRAAKRPAAKTESLLG